MGNINIEEHNGGNGSVSVVVGARTSAKAKKALGIIKGAKTPKKRQKTRNTAYSDGGLV